MSCAKSDQLKQELVGVSDSKLDAIPAGDTHEKIPAFLDLYHYSNFSFVSGGGDEFPQFQPIGGNAGKG